MNSFKTAFFDFDGVIVDTEPIYDIFWNEAGERYQTGIPNFADVIKGSTLPSVIKNYFSDRPEEFQQMVIREATAFEREMLLPAMPGTIEFIRMLKEKGVPSGLVTSSDDFKVERAFRDLKLEGLFDTVVTANRITAGKPDPMCYLLAAQDLGKDPSECLVFEDSFAGIAAGKAAGMQVIALSTTNPAETMVDKVYQVIPDFKNITFEDFLKW